VNFVGRAPFDTAVCELGDEHLAPRGNESGFAVPGSNPC
jgi:hypothetical protein